MEEQLPLLPLLSPLLLPRAFPEYLLPPPPQSLRVILVTIAAVMVTVSPFILPAIIITTFFQPT